MLMKRSIALLTLALLASCQTESEKIALLDSESAVARAEAGSADTSEAISSEEAKALLEQEDDVVVLDVRTPEEFEGGHVAGAVLLDYYAPDFLERLKAKDPEKTYLVYCAVGGRSQEVVHLMRELGFEHVYEAEDFDALKEAGIPVN